VTGKYPRLRSLRINRNRSTLRHMPPPTNVTSFAKHRVLREHAREAARLREFAASVTTGPLMARLLDEAEKHERLAQETKRASYRAI
jgi:hypothetical protein